MIGQDSVTKDCDAGLAEDLVDDLGRVDPAAENHAAKNAENHHRIPVF